MPWVKKDLTSSQYNLILAMEIILAERTNKDPNKTDDPTFDLALEAARERALKRQAQKAQEASSKTHSLSDKDEVVREVINNLTDKGKQ